MIEAAKQVGIWSLLTFAVAWAITLGPAPRSAVAAPPTQLTTFPENRLVGSEAGRLWVPRALEVDDATGGVYVVETQNDRVSEFDAWGQFVRAFGWDVAPTGVDELQEVAVRATSGQFTLSFGPDTTADLPVTATALEVEAALNVLPSVAAGGGSVTVEGGPGGIPGTTPSIYYVTFDGGPLAETDVAELSIADGTVPPNGGQPSTLLATRILATGRTAGTGLEVCTTSSGCSAGSRGSGPGQMRLPNGIALDEAGNIYILERSNLRVQKFGQSGNFQLMFGGEVNKTTNANLCTQADVTAGDMCADGVAGSANGFFEPPASFAGDYISAGEENAIFVGDRNRIQEFAPSGEYQSQIPLPEPGNPGTLGADPSSGDLYFSYFHTGALPDPPVYRLDASTGSVVDTLLIDPPGSGAITALAVASDGRVSVAFDPDFGGLPKFEPRLLVFSASGEVEVGYNEEFAAPSPPPSGAGLDASSMLATTTNAVGDYYVAYNGFPESVHVSYVGAYGPPPLGFGPPPKAPPLILDQFAASVGVSGATVRASINPRFWADTTYYVEYGTEPCVGNPCKSQPMPPGAILTDEVTNSAVPTSGVFLGNLAAGTTYHYRFVAQGTGGGPVFGPDQSFTTRVPRQEQPPCPNQAFRPGSAAFLPDCRAYEMVSPVDKNGADISVVFNSGNEPAGLDQAATDGNALTYSAYRAFGDAVSSPYTSQYMARRGGSGWASTSVSPPREGPSLYSSAGLDSQYKGFSEDICLGWLLQDADVPLSEGWVEGWPNLYRRDLCGSDYLTLGPLRSPAGLGSVDDYRPQVQGFSADGERTIFISEGRLTDKAVAAPQLYEFANGSPRLVCLLPGGAALKTGCSAGSGGGVIADRTASLENAISDDGDRIYWSDAAMGAGKIYVSVDQTETIAVSAGSAQFWTAAADGSKAIYSAGGELFEFRLAEEASFSIAKGFQGLMGASDDAGTVYFVSSEQLDEGASAGQPNLYRYQAGDSPTFDFIATLAPADLGGLISPVSTIPVRHTSRVNADGSALAFMSVARPGLTGADNTDVVSGQPDAQVYLYRVESDQLLCVSCNTTGARPTGREFASGIWVAGQIPAAENQLQLPQVLSDEGTRLFFESVDSLSVRDSNSALDVYEWEAPGTGNCTTSAPGYNATAGGCVSLISSGESTEDSEIVDASSDGRDVFFKTASSLRPEDPGLVDIYDARAGGGFPLPPQPAPKCLGEACQNAVPAPSDPSPSSEVFAGPPNRVHKGRGNRCPKGKHKVKRKGGKKVCVKKKGKKTRKARRSKHSREAGR